MHLAFFFASVPIDNMAPRHVWSAVFAVCFVLVHLAVSVPVMTGAPIDVPSNRSDVQRAARFAVNTYNKVITTEEYAYKSTSIVSSEVQVVAGLNFIMEVNLGLTQCKKTQTIDVESCPLQMNCKKLRCRFVVLIIPWEEVTLLTEIRCTTGRQGKLYQKPRTPSLVSL
ncbi:hypothetical protein AAFF_G00198520 [Aldrovandia affinis]|uniref:Cystatin domain-containing protein n=1 Tax=Aldrovandia affinis TaxID=143900 RepID=A0AAD7RID3_9TELE|nr:hypothetical protein AAFF_G00198520 [Aldrovandia affinis]